MSDEKKQEESPFSAIAGGLFSALLVCILGAVVIGLLVGVPFIGAWSFNTLFGTSVPYTIKSLIAIYGLTLFHGLMFRSSIQRKA